MTPGTPQDGQSESRFAVRHADDDDALQVVDTTCEPALVVCTCWEEPNFAHDIARLLNSDEADHA